MELSPTEFLAANSDTASGSPAAQRLRDAGYPHVMMTSGDWNQCHSWCTDIFGNNGYNWTGSLFWFQWASDRDFFHAAWNLGFLHHWNRGLRHAVVVADFSLPPLAVLTMMRELDRQQIKDVKTRLAAVDVPTSPESFAACSVGLMDEDELTRAALAGFEPYNLNHYDFSRRPDCHD